ncbi:MAG: protein kinase [Phycisphaeraceae bacterium]|nr:protein kinase [Phycisphaeraceae bacterium]
MNEHDNKPNRDRVRSIFDEVAGLPPTERAAALGRLCGNNPALRAEVEALLGSHDAAGVGGFMTSPTAATTIRNATITEAPGSRVGPYKLLQVIGEGGFGTVFLAEQTDPVRRRVALKIIKLGMDTKQVIARFEAERQALALMDHPHIARVLDAGATPITEHGGGRPYFVMEYVVGDAITQFAANNTLDLRARLELFAQVCSAVQHAHTKGIIHRDIKPGNVLVTMTDGKPFARVIDFGIAKATASAGGLTDKTLFTEHRQLIGTPEYMSPEQAQGSPDIDTRTDVYALGVLLYELLAGDTPFDGKRLRSAAWDEMRRIIKEEEPPTPSVRVTQRMKVDSSLVVPSSVAPLSREVSSDPAQVAEGRPAVERTNPSHTALESGATKRKVPFPPSTLRGELDWIVMKSLDKDRARRYETPSALAADVERHLKGEAVVAAPPSAGYRLRKFVRRNKGPVIAGSAVAAALLVGIAGTTWGWNRAARASVEADYQARLAGESAARAEMQRHFAERANRALVAFLQGRFDDPDVRYVGSLNNTAITPGNGFDPNQPPESLPADLRELAAMSMETAQRVLAAQEELRDKTDAAEWSAYVANIFAALSDPYSARRYLSACAEHLRNWEWQYLWASSDASRFAVLAPGEPAHWMRADFVSNGELVAALSECGQIVCLDAHTGEEISSSPESVVVRHFSSSPRAGLLGVLGSRIDPLTGSKTSFAEAWDCRTLQPRYVLPGEPTFSSSGERIYAAGKVLNASDGSVITSIDASARYKQFRARFSANDTDILTWGVATGENAKYRIDLWDGTSGECLYSVEGLSNDLDLYVGGEIVLTTTSDGHGSRYSTWDASSLTPIGTFETAWMTLGAAVSPDGRHVLVRPYNEAGRVYEIATGKLVQEFTEELHGVHGGEFSPDGARIVANAGPFVCIWDANTGKRLAKLAGHGDSWINTTYSPDGSKIVSYAWDGTFRIWDATTLPQPSFEAPDDPIYRVGFEKAHNSLFNGTHILAPHWSGGATAALIDVDNGRPSSTWTIPSPEAWEGHAGIQSAFFSHDGTRVFTRRGSSVRAWNVATAASLGEAVIPVHINNPSIRSREISERHGGTPERDPVSLRCDHAGKRLLACLGNGLVRVYDMDTGDTLFEATGDGYPCGTLNADGSVAAIAWSDHSLKLYDVESGRLVQTLNGHSGHVVQVLFDPSGRFLATRAEDRTIRLWETDSGAHRVLTEIDQAAFDGWQRFGVASFDSHGSRMAYFVNAGCVVVDTDTGETVSTLKGHAWAIDRAIFSPDGSRIFTASLDNTIRVWETATGREVLVLRPEASHEDGFDIFQLSSDGTRLVARYKFDQTIHVFDTLPFRKRHTPSR